MPRFGRPHRHLRVTGSTNERARELALQGAPGGTVVTADEQTSGRGRRQRAWVTPPGKALLYSAIVRPLEREHALLPLAVPQLAHVGGSVNNDVLLVLLGAAVAVPLVAAELVVSLEVAAVDADVGTVEPDHPATLGDPPGCDHRIGRRHEERSESSTASSIAGVSRPVNVLWGLTW